MRRSLSDLYCFCVFADECPRKYLRFKCAFQVAASVLVFMFRGMRRVVQDFWRKVLLVSEAVALDQSCRVCSW